MPRLISVVTPENIPITLEPAGLATRFGALVIDLLIQGATILVGWIIGAILIGIFGWVVVGSTSTALLIIGTFLVVFGYSILFETIWNGQTPGKRMFHLRVMRDGGYPVNFYSVATRNLVRIADFLPMGYGVGALSVFFHPQYKRLGDMAAGTLVVREKEVGSIGFFGKPKDLVPANLANAPRLPAGTNDPLTVLTTSEIEVLRKFALRCAEMTPDDAERLGYRLTVPLVGRLNITFVQGVAPAYAHLIIVLVSEIDRRLAEQEIY